MINVYFREKRIKKKKKATKEYLQLMSNGGKSKNLIIFLMLMQIYFNAVISMSYIEYHDIQATKTEKLCI